VKHFPLLATLGFLMGCGTLFSSGDHAVSRAPSNAPNEDEAITKYYTLSDLSAKIPGGAEFLKGLEESCKREARAAGADYFNPQTRDLFFEVFANVAIANPSQSLDALSKSFSKTLGMSMKESLGTTAMVCDMDTNGSALSMRLFRAAQKDRPSAEKSKSDLEAVDRLLSEDSINFNHQTNFGVVQMSPDRLSFNETFLTKSFAVLRPLAESNPREMARMCGTTYAFYDEAPAVEEKLRTLGSCEMNIPLVEKAMRGSVKKGTAESIELAKSSKCFGSWMMLCPSLNVELATATKSAYFQTRGEAPLCAATLRTLGKQVRALDL
jgi:hypothetical protein